MSIKKMVEARENEFLKDLQRCEASGLKTYIFGGGQAAHNVKACLDAVGFAAAGMLENRAGYRERDGVFCLEELLERTDEKINLIPAFNGYTKELIQPFWDRIDILLDRDCYMAIWENDPHFFSHAFLEEHERELQWVYDHVADDYSKRTLVAYINQKISWDYQYLSAVKSSSPQYFEQGIVRLRENEVFVDCGAYIGDSALSFVQTLQDRGISSYSKIISFEPDPRNFERLCELGLKSHVCIPKGTFSREAELHLSLAGTASTISEHGGVTVEMIPLDLALEHERVTFIKMDIEGAELESLRGARHCICRDRPTLAICIYHKRGDLWQIPQYIHELVPDYKLYIRAYQESATELVLYGIPEERA